MDNMNSRVSKVVKAALIASLYVGMTFAFSFMSYGMIQFRISEILVALVFFEPASTAGLCLGCFIANLIGPGAVYDAVIGTFASFAGLYIITRHRRRGGKPAIGLFFYSIINALLVSFELCFIMGTGTQAPYIVMFLWALLGEVATATVGGTALYYLLKKRWKDIVGETEKG